MFPTHGESILFALAASTGTGPPTISGTATERAAYDLQEANSQPGVTASQLVFPALRCRISSQGCRAERKPVRLVAEFLWATRIAMFPFKALGLSCKTIGECHHA